MRDIHRIEGNSAFIGRLPRGCKLCGQGMGLVLTITGKCNRRCFYCPLSKKERASDEIFANELSVKKLDDIVKEGRTMSAKATGITGGDPMVTPKLTLKAIKLLKAAFGKSHHIHLYTGGNFDIKYIEELSKAGLDEVRLHPPHSTWAAINKRFDKLLKAAVATDMSVGVEIPCLPGYEDSIINLAYYLASIDATFLNLIELLFSGANSKRCSSKGYLPKHANSAAAKGSEKSAHRVLSVLAKDNNLKLNVHYCSFNFRYDQQIPNRLLRRAKNVIRPLEILTDDLTFLLGIIMPSSRRNLRDLKKILNPLVKKHKVPDNLVVLNSVRQRIEIASSVLQRIASELPREVRKHFFIVKEYPTADRLEVIRMPLDKFIRQGRIC